MSTTYTPNRINGPKRIPRRYVTQCKLCPFAIYDGDRSVWLSSPLGLSHASCAGAR